MEEDVSSQRPLWSIRKYKKGDEQGILELFRLSGIKRTMEEWLWECGDNPFGNFIAVSEYEEQVVGHMTYLPVPMKIGERIGMGCQVVDVLVHPFFRGQGMFLALGKALASRADEEGIGVFYGFPNRPSGHLKYGGPRTHIVCRVPELVKFVKTGEIETKYRIPRAVAKILLWISSITTSVFARVHLKTSKPTKGGANLVDVKIRAIASFDDRIDDFWKRVSRRYDITVIRNRKYLNWRYSKKPNAKYAILLAEKKEKILGYIVLRSRSEKNLKIGYIVDILASSKNVAQLLISKAVKHFKKEDVDIIRCSMLKNNVYYHILRYNNFIPVGSTWFLARVHPSLSEKFVRDYTKWYVTMGDGDYI